MALEVTVINGGGTAAATVDITDRLRADAGLQLGNRAFQGESSQSTLVLDDDDGEYGNEEDLPSGLTMLSIAAHNVVTVKETATTPDTVLVRGRVIPKEIGRGDLWQDRGRQLTVRLDDYNADLKGLTLLADVARSSETDVARVTWVFDTYLSGSPRFTTDLTSGIVSTPTVTMPAKTYEAGTPIIDILSDCAVTAEKTFFVMADGTFYYASHSNTSKVAGLRISDRDDEIDLDPTTGTATVLESNGFGTVTEINSITVPSGSGGLIYVICTDETYTPSSIVYRSNVSSPATDVALTLIGEVTHPTASSGSNFDGDKLAVYYLASPTESHAVNGAQVRIAPDFNVGGAVGWWVVDSNATPTVYTNSGTGSITSVTPTANAGDLVLDCAGYRFWSLGDDSNTPTAESGQTEDWADAFNNTAGQNDMAWGGGSLVGSGARSWDLIKSTNWVASAIVIPGAIPTYPPIWTGPASTEDGQGLLSGAVLRYGGGQFVTETRASVADDYDYWVEAIHDAGAVDATDAANRLSAILDIRQFEKRTYQVAVQLHREKVDLLQAGQIISIKARAIPDADDQYRQRRIASLEWQWVGPEHWLAVMELDRPLNMKGAGAGSGSGQAALANRPKDASQTTYDNTSSGLTGDTVQEAIDELAAVGGSPAATDLSLGTPANISTTGSPAFLNFPGIAKLDADHLLLVYRQATDHDTSDDGKIVYKIGTIGTDYAVTWGSQSDVIDGALDYRDPEVAVLSDGTPVVSYFTWDGATSYNIQTLTGSWDGSALTWDTPVSVTTSFTAEACSAKVVELFNGDLILPIYGHNGGNHTSALVRSSDGGATWGSQTTIVTGTVGDGNNWTEPYIVRLADGRLHCLIREDTDGRIYRTTSSDGGATWSTATNVFAGDARPAHIQVQSGGLLYVSRGVPASNSDTIYRQSSDYGETWTDETILDTSGTQNEYASIVQIDSYRYGVAYAIQNTSTDADIKYVEFTDAANLDIIRGIGERTAAATALDDLTDDVTLTSPADGQVLTYNGFAWVNEAIPATNDVFTVDPGNVSYAGTTPTVTVTSLFGIDGSGNPYYNAANVTSGEEAALMRDATTGEYFLRPYNF